MKLVLERDGECWYILRGDGLGRVADTNTRSRVLAEKIRQALRTGALERNWNYDPPTPGPGASFGRIWRNDIELATVWEPQHTRLPCSSASPVE